MKLNHLGHVESCPVCKAPVIKTQLTFETHTNGQRWENVTFNCRGEIGWVPNFSDALWNRICPKNEEYLAEQKLNEAAKKKVMTFVNSLDESEMKSRMINELGNMRTDPTTTKYVNTKVIFPNPASESPVSKAKK